MFCKAKCVEVEIFMILILKFQDPYSLPYWFGVNKFQMCLLIEENLL